MFRHDTSIASTEGLKVAERSEERRGAVAEGENLGGEGGLEIGRVREEA